MPAQTRLTCVSQEMHASEENRPDIAQVIELIFEIIPVAGASFLPNSRLCLSLCIRARLVDGHMELETTMDS